MTGIEFFDGIGEDGEMKTRPATETEAKALRDAIASYEVCASCGFLGGRHHDRCIESSIARHPAGGSSSQAGLASFRHGRGHI